MKVTVLQESLAHGLSIVSRAVSPRSTLPVLSNVLIATDEGRLRLSATNLELGITCWIGAKIEEEGSTTVPARTFVDLVGTLPQEQVSLSLATATQTLNVRCGASNTDIKCIDAQEFPPLPVPEMEGAIVLNVADFKEMISQVVFAASVGRGPPGADGCAGDSGKGYHHHGRRGRLPPVGAQGYAFQSACPAGDGHHPGTRPGRTGARWPRMATRPSRWSCPKAAARWSSA